MNLFDNHLLQTISRNLISKKETIAVAESMSSGVLQLALSALPDSAGFYQGGLTSYTLGQHRNHFQPGSARSSETHECVSQSAAVNMSFHIAELYSSDWGVGITGYTQPVPESDNRVYAWYAIAHKNKLVHTEKISLRKNYPAHVQVQYANFVLEKISSLVS
jgi:nicotinamide-nucleotide amidase